MFEIIEKINNENKIFVLIIGGSASGKNYIYAQHFNFPLIDIDEINNKLSGHNLEKSRTLIAQSISCANKKLETAFKNETSIAQVTTGANLKAIENKIKKAESFGFTTALILIDTNIEIAIERNKKRSLFGDQNLIPEWKVEKTNIKAKETFNKLTNLITYKLIIRN